MTKTGGHRMGRVGGNAVRGMAGLCLASGLVAACEESDSASTKGAPAPLPEKGAVAEPAVAVEAARPQPAAELAAASVDQADFGTFWEFVRDALILGDADALAPFVRFPLQMHGTLDDDPELWVQPEEFSRVFELLLEDDVGLSFGIEPLRDYVIRLDALPPKAVTGDSARVASLAFERNPGPWRLVLVYLDTLDTSAWRK